jgi:hypothetical protein
MGYRSEVVLTVHKELMPHFLSVLAKEPASRTLVFKESDSLHEDYDGEGSFLVSWSDIKWYRDSFPEIRAIQRFVDDCDGDDIEGVDDPWDLFRFVRLGEDFEDIEEKGELNSGNIFITRSLSF